MCQHIVHALCTHGWHITTCIDRYIQYSKLAIMKRPVHNMMQNPTLCCVTLVTMWQNSRIDLDILSLCSSASRSCVWSPKIASLWIFLCYTSSTYRNACALVAYYEPGFTLVFGVPSSSPQINNDSLCYINIQTYMHTIVFSFYCLPLHHRRQNWLLPVDLPAFLSKIFGIHPCLQHSEKLSSEEVTTYM